MAFADQETSDSPLFFLFDFFLGSFFFQALGGSLLGVLLFVDLLV